MHRYSMPILAIALTAKIREKVHLKFLSSAGCGVRAVESSAREISRLACLTTVNGHRKRPEGELNMNPQTVGRRFLAAATATVCLAVSAVFAFEAPSQPLAERVATADAVVQAVVRDIEYRMSEPNGEQPPIPFTFVTFDIERVIRGQVDGGELTLRFHGGLFPDGRFLDDPTVPLFDVGERSILLVSRNGELDVPLVGWRFGRLRVIDGRVYDDFGKPLLIVSRNRVKFAKTVRFEEIVEHTLGTTGRSFNPRFRELPPLSTEVQDDAGPGGRSTDARPTVDEAAALDALVTWVRALPLDASVQRITRVAKSEDPNVPFAARHLPAVAPSRVR